MVSAKEMNDLIQKYRGTEKEVMLTEMLKGVAVLTRRTPGFEQIKKAQDLINKDGFDLSINVDKPYLLTTRNQRYLDKTLPKDAESAFVILSSGDTLFELVSRGVSKIVTVDVNDLQSFIFKLRRASIMTLSPNEFEGFLVDSNGSRFMSLDMYKDVREAFSKDDIELVSFWDNILSINSSSDLAKHFFKGVGGDLSKIRYSIPYLKKKGLYYSLRDKLERAQITIKLSEALTYLQEHTDDKFDYIDIANILLFIYQIQCNDDKEKYNEVLRSLRTIYDTNLNNGGVMVIDYLFGVNLKSLSNISEDNPDKRLVQEIYKYTYEKLQELFELESCIVEKLISGFGNESDTVVYTKK